ncbi:MAG: EamA family transporter [Candidatus Lokiarchaeota archaeon]|nr:EamA family transporter [Candidatus Lokiarchaeota archaeon]
MQNKHILNIILANLLWSIVPILASDLFKTQSIIMVIFQRFLISGIILFIITIILTLYNNKISEKEKIPFSQLFNHLLKKNEGFFGLKYYIYFLLLGFLGIILHILGYFFALKLASISFALVGFQLSIIIIAFYEHGVRLERLDIFKALYLLILIFCIIIISYIKFQDPSQTFINSSFVGWFYIILFAVCVSFLHIGISKDTYKTKEVDLLNRNSDYKIIRMLLKLSLVFILGFIPFIPFLIIIYFFPLESHLYNEIILFVSDLPNFINILFDWRMILLIVFSTIIPYLLMFISNANWSQYNLTYSQWMSILTIIEPILSLVFGYIIIGEYFPLEYLIIVLFLLVISILFRYAHEARSKVNAYILLRLKQGLLNSIPIKLLKLDGVCCVQSLIGTYDLLLNIKTNSIKDIYKLINKEIRQLEGIDKIEILFINKINKVNQ